MRCPQCGYLNSPSNTKCANCGFAFPKPGLPPLSTGSYALIAYQQEPGAHTVSRLPPSAMQQIDSEA